MIRIQVGLFSLDEAKQCQKGGGKKKERVIKGEQSTLYYKIIKLTVDQWEIKKAYDPKTVMTLGSSIDVHFQRNTL